MRGEEGVEDEDAVEEGEGEGEAEAGGASAPFSFAGFFLSFSFSFLVEVSNFSLGAPSVSCWSLPSLISGFSIGCGVE